MSSGLLCTCGHPEHSHVNGKYACVVVAGCPCPAFETPAMARAGGGLEARSSKLEASSPYVTRHALDRYREHHRDAEYQDLAAAVLRGREELPEVVRAMFGRASDPVDSRYVVSDDFQGVFVLSTDKIPSVITYLRCYSEEQRAFLRGGPVVQPEAEPFDPEAWIDVIDTKIKNVIATEAVLEHFGSVHALRISLVKAFSSADPLDDRTVRISVLRASGPAFELILTKNPDRSWTARTEVEGLELVEKRRKRREASLMRRRLAYDRDLERRYRS